MRRSRLYVAALASACLLGAFAAVGVACLDTTPLVYVPPTPDAEPPPVVIDAGPDAPDVDTRPPCQLCVESPDDGGAGCADELAACTADPKCNAAYACIVLQGCLNKESQRKVILCGLPCAAAAGIVTQDEPAAVEIYAVAVCAQTSCADACHISDAGLPDH